MNGIRWSKTAGDYMMMQRKMNATYNQSDERQRTYYEWWRAYFPRKCSLSSPVFILARSFDYFSKGILAGNQSRIDIQSELKKIQGSAMGEQIYGDEN